MSLDASGGIDREPRPIETKAVRYDEFSYGGNVAIEMSRLGDTIDFSNPPYGPHEKFVRGGGTPVLVNEIGKLETGLFGAVDATNLIMDAIRRDVRRRAAEVTPPSGK